MSAADQVGGSGPQTRPRRAHALELILDADDEAALRRRWAHLDEAGVASPARHTGATHRPHVTLASGPRPPGSTLETAARLLGALLPVDLPVAGLALLGSPSRYTLAELVVPAADLQAAREELAVLWPGADPRPWLVHLTLAQRLAPSSVGLALTALGSEPGEPVLSRRAVGLRWWDPDMGTVVHLAGGGADQHEG